MATRRFTRSRSARRLAALRPRWRRLGPTLAIAAGAGLLVSAGTVLWWSKDLPNPQNIGQRQVVQSTKIFDRTGTHLLYEIGEVRRTTIALNDIATHLRSATLAAEDDQFYQHHGIDLFGIARGVILKPLSGQRTQGGSTITQQLIKNSILTSERTLRRKVKEVVLALELEQRFSKDEILTMYLNEIPYGSRAYGVEAAAQTFFGTSARDITLAQAATLAALPKAPSYYSPYGSHREDLKRRQEYILQRMVDLKMVSQEQADRATAEQLSFRPQRESIEAPHFVFYVKEFLESQFGQRVVEQGGLKVITTLDYRLQKIAETVLQERRSNLNQLGASNASLVALDPKTGDILAMSGSIDYFDESIDGNVNVSVRHRSPGSSIKPFIYAAAFLKGYTPDTILIDAETDFGKGYTPKNYDLSQRGPVTMRQALANSLNIPAVKTLYLAGIRNATDLAQKMGMSSLNDPDRYGLSLVLGGGEVRLIDLASAYGVFAADGTRHPHRALLSVQDGTTTVFDAAEENDKQPAESALPTPVAQRITNILSDNAARAMVFGTGSPLQLGTRPVAAKTGTTQGFRDGWTVGFTPSLVAGVWVGNNDNSPMGSRGEAVRTAGPVWNAFMRRALENTPIEQFTPPPPLTNVPHAIMRGEIPEVKAKWDRETNTYYSADCPIALGQPVTVKEIHSLLFSVQRDNPLGPPPARAEADPQFDRWEAAVAAWIDKHNRDNRDKSDQPRYVMSLPTLTCDVGSSENLPIVKITEPSTTIVRDSPVTIAVTVETEKTIKEVRFLLDGATIATRRGDEPFTASFSFPATLSGRKTLLVQAITEDNLIGRAHRTFIINPDDSPPSLTLHTPVSGSTVAPTAFPFTVKATASDPSGIALVDILYQKEGTSGSQRIGRTSTLAPTAPNRYEVIWQDSPGPGTYLVSATAYDTTGNSTTSPLHTVTISE